MAIYDVITIPRLKRTETKNKWFKLEGGIVYRNTGVNAMIAFGTDTEQPIKEGSMIAHQNNEVEAVALDVPYVRQDSYFSYEFTIVG